MQRQVGRPRKWQSPQELVELINNYLEATPFEEWSVTGLALTLGTSKQLLIDYQKREEFREVINEAKLLIEHSYELSLRKNGRTGDIFALKNFDWRDRTEQDITSDGKPIIMDSSLIAKNATDTSTEGNS